MGIRDYFRQRAIKRNVKRHAKAKAKQNRFEQAQRIYTNNESDKIEYQKYVKDYYRYRKDRQARKALGRKMSFKEFKAKKGVKL